MAKIEIKLPEDVLLKLSRIGERTDEIIPKVLEEGGELEMTKDKHSLAAVVGRNTKIASRSTGESEHSLGLSKARQK
jgi:hypothetical protein